MEDRLNQAHLVLTAAELAQAFPFHFAVDRSWRVVQFGAQLPKVCPRIRIGSEITHAFRLVRPEIASRWKTVEAHVQALFLFQCLGTDVLLRGQMLILESGQEMIFLGSPWFTSANDLLASGLGLENFAIHDPGTDMLLVMQAQTAAVAELKDLADRLTRQRAALHATNDRLKQQNTELAAAQEALARSESEARLLGLVAARTNNGVVITDAGGQIVWVNAGFQRITGYTLEDVRGKTPGSILQGPGTDPSTVAFMRERLRERLGFNVEVLNYNRNGTPYWLAIEVQPIFDDQGRLTNYLAIETDITDRRRSEEALRAEKELLGTILAGIIDGVIAVDPEHRVQMLNPTAEALTGWSQADARGRLLSEIFQLQSIDGTKRPDLMGGAFATREAIGDLHELEPHWTLRSRHGTLRMVVASARPMLRVETGIVGGLVTFRDVTGELEADEMKRDFVYAVSHELRTPLTSIRGFLATLESDPDLPMETRCEFLRIVSEQALRLSRLVEDILEISRIEAGQIHMEYEPVDLGELARLAIQEILPLTVRKQQQLDINVAHPLPRVLGDPDRVRSIFGNLLGNAVKFTPERGRIHLEITTDGDHHVTLVVGDNGVGIPTEMQDRVFQKFFRVRRPGEQVAGTGLGLSIVQAVVQHMGGQIQLQSAPGQGTRFTVRLPVAPRKYVPPESPRPIAPP
jgi:PAS domain S-box-containing protein